MRRTRTLTVVVGLLLLGSGCGDTQLATVTGLVTVDGEPLAKGAIAFIPKDGQSAPAGDKILDGRFTVLIVPGLKEVRITADPKVVGKEALYDTPDSRTKPIVEQPLPPRYNRESELEMDVKPGKNPPKEFHLSTR